jgi:signal transduction histidine kinase
MWHVGITPGIHAEEQHLIFKLFYEASQRKDIREGMGLGLSITRD